MADLEFSYRREANPNQPIYVPKVILEFSNPNGLGKTWRTTPTADTGSAFITLNKTLAAIFDVTLPAKPDGHIKTGAGERVSYYLCKMGLKLIDERNRTAEWVGEVAFLEPQPLKKNEQRSVSTLFGRHQGLDLFTAVFDGKNRKLELTAHAAFASYSGRLQKA